MAAMKEGGEVGGSAGTKPREKVLSGEDHVWFPLEAEREEPGEIGAAEMVLNTRQKRERSTSRNLIAILAAPL